MNKLVFSLALFATILMVMPVFGVSFRLDITSVQPNVVTGDLRINNSSDSPVTWQFPSSGQFDIWVDNSPSSVAYLDILTSLTIPAHSIIIVEVFHYRDTPLTLGMHNAQARFVTADQATAGTSTNFLFGTPISGVEYLDYSFEITSISSHSVHGICIMTNNNDSPWRGGFFATPIAVIKVDGIGPNIIYGISDERVTIDPWDSHTEEVMFCTSYPLAVGPHVAQVYLQCDDVPAVGNPITFIIAPSTTDDPFQISPPPLQLSYGPNPFRDNVKLSFNTKAPVTLSIYNHKGQLVKAVNASETYTWDGISNTGEACAKGIYYLKAQQGKNSVVRKLIRL